MPALNNHYKNVSTYFAESPYGMSEARVKEALAFYQAHRTEIDASIQADSQLEPARG